MADATPAPKWSEPDISGFHNTNLPESTLRVWEGRSWQKTDTIVIIPCGDHVPSRAMATWMNLQKPPNQACPTFPLIGMEVGEAYSTFIEQAIRDPQFANYKYLMTIEHDNTVPQFALVDLLKRMEQHPEFACIGGLYWLKGHNGVAQIWGDKKDPVMNFRPQPPDLNGGLVECWGTGMGCNVWRLSMFRDPRLPRPLFRTKCSPTDGIGTQDLAFWAEAQKYGYRCAIDCSVRVGHLDVATNTLW